MISDLDIYRAASVEDLVRLWQHKRGDRVVPSWADFDFYDFKGWHGRIGVHDISYDPFDYNYRLSGTEIDRVFGRTMTGVKGSELAEMRVVNPLGMEFYEMTCRQMLITRISGPVNLKGRAHIETIFVDIPLSDDGQRSTHSFEALDFSGT